MKKSIFYCLVLFLVLLGTNGLAWADNASLGRLGEGVYPLRQTEVRLVEEQVTLEVWPEKTLVDALLVFENTAPKAVDLLMGFPDGEKIGPVQLKV